MSDDLLVPSEAPPSEAPLSAPPSMAPATKADWNTESWKDHLDEDLRNDPSLKHIKDIPSAIKSYVHAQRMVGQDKFNVPNKYATPDEWDNIYNKLGRPESADKYDIKLEENSMISPEFLQGFKASAHKAGLNPAQASEFMNFYGNQVKEAQTQIAAYEEQQSKEEVEGLKKEWGAAYPSKIKAAQEALTSFGGPEIMNYLKESGLDKDVTLAKFFAKIGEALTEDNNAEGGHSQSNALTPSQAHKEINAMMTNPAYFDKEHPDHARLVEYAVELRNWTKV